MPNETVDDAKNLDLTALGLLTAFLRHKDGWDITLADIGAKYGHGEDAMANAMGALQIARYVVKVRVMGAGNQWRTEMAVYAPPASDAEVEQLLADIRAEDPAVRRVEVIEPTATAIKRAQTRRDKLAKKTAASAAKKAKAASGGLVCTTPTFAGIPTKDRGYVYVLFSEQHHAFKIGMCRSDRLAARTNQRNTAGWTLLERTEFPSWEDARRVEQAALEHLRGLGVPAALGPSEMPDGWTETVSANQVSREQLWGLIRAVHQGSPAPAIPRVGERTAPDSGVSRLPENPRVSKNTVVALEEDENDSAVADAVGKSAGGFASAGASDGAAGESGEAGSGSAASRTTLPTQRKKPPRPVTTKTRPRKESAGFEMVRAAIPAAVASPGTKLWTGLHRAINDLLDGNAAAGIPRRTPDQVIARINRRWYGENAEARATKDYRGCDRCTASGCTAPRRGLEDLEGCDRIKNRCAWLASALLAQDCPDPSCEDGQVIGGGECSNCRERAAENREAAQAAAAASAKLQADTEALAAARSVVAAWDDAEATEETRYRRILGEAGVWGVKLNHQVNQHMTGWRERNPRPAAPAATATTSDRR
ncbi:GIY-YIG nuclease family protein [Streptomyces niveus]|uniref:GIY-YIG nuclease family protein n=1 Tax=Streptomyces niveus TaxID=193462 RepID=UPI0036E9B86B